MEVILMYTLEDYITYYGNSSFKEVPFNHMDALIFTMFPYLPVDTIKDGTKLSTLYKMVEKASLNERGAPYYIRLLIKKMIGTKRYEEIACYHSKKIVDQEIQFGAMTIRFPNGTFVAYEGTNLALIGWKENFLLACTYHTKTQQEALKYFKKTINYTDKNVYVGGHSKGGNLAMYIGMETPKNLFKKIKMIYNFDGPGFRKKEFYSDKYQRLREKLFNLLPDGSLVGIIMNNTNYHVVETNGIGMEKHSPSRWHIFGQFFVPNNLYDSSAKLHDSLNERLENLKEEDMIQVIDTFFGLLNEHHIKTREDLKMLKMIEIKKMFDDAKNLDEESKKVLIDMIKMFFTSNKKRSKK